MFGNDGDEWEDEIEYPGVRDDDEPPTPEEIEAENRMLLRRQAEFREAAEYLAKALAWQPGVRKVVLFGSVARPLVKEIPRFRKFRNARQLVWHECKDVDLAVWVSDLGRLRALQKACTKALTSLLEEKEIGVAHHQVDVFLFEPGTDRYLGRLCSYATCPKAKRECLVPGCGARPFLQQHEGFTLDPHALRSDRSIVLHETRARP